MVGSQRSRPPIRVAAAGDLHCREDHHGRFREWVDQLNREADLVLLCGDLTDRGWPKEAVTLAAELSRLKIPCVAVFGNHDHEGGEPEFVSEVLTRAGVTMLDGDHYRFEGGDELGVAGVKGFAGGFGNAMLQAFGEPLIKSFVSGAVEEAMKLEGALQALEGVRHKLVITHYAPVHETVVGENVEIYPFLGTSRLSLPVDHLGAQMVFHGHAHQGSPHGRTPGGVPVYNVAMPLLARIDPKRRFLLVEI